MTMLMSMSKAKGKRLLLIVCLFFAVSIYATPFGLVDTKKLSIKVLSAAPTVLPAAGKEFIYPKADGFWYTLNSAGTETRLSPFLTSVFGRTGAVVAQAGDYTAADVGLGNIDNTSDLNKPISTATQAALDAKQAALGFTAVPDTRTINTYPLSGDVILNKSDVGLANVDNTADIDKPISTATQTALDLKLNTSGIAADLNIPAMTTEASPATGMYLVIENAGTRKKVDWSSLPGSTGGEINTASNTGTAGVGVFKQKNVLDLELYKLLGSGGINVILNGTDYIDVKLNITGLTEDLTPASGDYFVMYDTVAGSYKKIDSDNMPGSGGSGDMSASTYDPVLIAEQLVGISATQTLINKTLTSPVLNTSVSGTAILDEDNMVSDSPTQLATQQSIKAYVDSTTYLTASGSVPVGERGSPATVQAVEGQNSSSATKLLIENQIADAGATNTTPISITNVGVALDGSNNLVFDGATAPDYLQMPVANFTSTFALLQEWKVDLWVYPNTTRIQSVLLGAVGSATNTLGIRIEDGNRLTTYWNGWTAVNTQLSTAGTIVNNTWHFITIEKWLDVAQWKVDIYIDGTKQTTHSVSDFALYTTSDFYVSHNETDRGFIGSVNKVRVNNKAEHFGVNFTPPSRTTAYTTDDIMYDTSVTEVTSPAGTEKLSGRNASNEPIEVSISNLPGSSASVNAQTGTTYTLVIGDANDIITMNNAAANTLTIPLNSSVAFPVGTIIAIDQIGAGATTITGATGVTVNGTSAGSETITAQYLGACAKKIATDTWIVQGGI